MINNLIKNNKIAGLKKLILVYPTDPNIEIIGGGTRRMRYLLKQAVRIGMKVKFVGVKLGSYAKKPYDYDFIPLLKNSDKWWKYLIVSLFKVPFLKFEQDAIIHTQRLIYLLPYVIFHPSNPKICNSDQPLITASMNFPYPVYWVLSKIFALIERYIVKRIDAITANKSVLKEYYEKRYPDIKKKLKYEINASVGINTDIFKPLESRAEIRKSFGIPSEDRVVLFVGRLAPIKRVDFLIDSFIKFRNNIPESRFLIVGRGESEEKLREYAGKYKNSCIEFLGEKKGLDLVKIYNCADVLLLASQTEGNPTVVREALACGIPVVSTNVGDMKDVINHLYLGKIVSYKASPKEFKAAIMDVMQQDKNKVQEMCRIRGLEFSEENTFKDIYNLYLHLTSQKV